MTVRIVGLMCRAWGCPRPHWEDGLCALCWNRSRAFRRPDELICDCEVDDSRCFLCHGEKLLNAGRRRARETRQWMNDWGVKP